ncbi:Uncharacterised protein [Dermatophilus congolensis]|uniref:Uncharacterized protein n=1 Tax=Dermatophilus congolensis TaxID=1863 RepID=A0AA46GZK7_9MICO|nr:Uncharacterised protein [Dermatophilus congolensis]
MGATKLAAPTITCHLQAVSGGEVSCADAGVEAICGTALVLSGTVANVIPVAAVSSMAVSALKATFVTALGGVTMSISPPAGPGVFTPSRHFTVPYRCCWVVAGAQAR